MVELQFETYGSKYYLKVNECDLDRFFSLFKWIWKAFQCCLDVHKRNHLKVLIYFHWILESSRSAIRQIDMRYIMTQNVFLLARYVHNSNNLFLIF